MARSQQVAVRLVDVAARARVTATVVSQVLRGGGSSTTRVSPVTAERVRRLAEQMGYRPNVLAQRLKGKPGDLIGVLIGADTTPANLQRLSAVERAAHRRGLRLMIGQFHGSAEDTQEYLHDFLARGIESLVCFNNPAPVYEAPLLPLLQRFRAAIFQTAAPHPSFCTVDVDRADGVAQAYQHLVERGRRRIALVLNDSPRRDALMEDRLRGWRAGALQANLPAGADLRWHGSGQFPPTPLMVNQAVKYLQQAGADAVIASNDVWALHLIRQAKRAGLMVPRDLAVVGFDNLDACDLCDPALTTIDQNNQAFADAAIKMLSQMLSGVLLANAQRRAVVRPQLVIRESTGCFKD
jgi:DNA-binding LacI/PurR family transcriptional regulator